MLKKTLLALAFTGLAVAAFAQQPGIKRTPLQKVEFPDGYNTITAIAEVPAGGAAGRHTHPGIETGYGVVHDAKAHGDKSMKVLGVYVVDKTKPLASPAP